MNDPLPGKFVARMRAQLKSEEAFSAFLRSYERPPARGLRVNTLKISVEDFLKISPFSLQPVPWESAGFYVEEEKIGRHPYHAAGLYYSQEPSAMSVAPLLDARPGEKVLDLCAAPGGKSTQLARTMAGKGLLVCNEVIPDRASVLSQNIERMGIRNAVVSNADVSLFAGCFPAFFDKVLVDAPCSGEGMFKKNEQEAIANWSEEGVTLCAARQKTILSAAARTVKAGGRLAYSTCTFAPEEDEGQADDFLRTHPDFSLVTMGKLYPHETRGEGHFYALFEKKEGACPDFKGCKPLRGNLTAKEKGLFSRFCDETLKEPPRGALYRAGETLYLLPEEPFPSEGLPVLRAGVRLGSFLKNRFEPAHAFALALTEGEVLRTANFDAAAIGRYLHGETMEVGGENGWRLVTVDSFPIGWGKVTGGVLKNHYPKGLRR